MCDHFLYALPGRRNSGLLKKAALCWKGSAALIFSVLMISWPLPSFAQAETAAAVHKPVEAPKPVDVQKAVEAQKPDEAASYHYDAKGKIDPFKPYLNLEVAKVTTNKPNRNLPRTPLQEIGLDQFKLVGIALGSNRKAAMVEDPKGKGYIIGEGTVIGHNGGRVVEILRDRMIIEERILDGTGKNRTQRTVIKLHKDEKEGRL
jgi:Tfp pilus assembly protein PilP